MVWTISMCPPKVKDKGSLWLFFRIASTLIQCTACAGCRGNTVVLTSCSNASSDEDETNKDTGAISLVDTRSCFDSLMNFRRTIAEFVSLGSSSDAILRYRTLVQFTSGGLLLLLWLLPLGMLVLFRREEDLLPCDDCDRREPYGDRERDRRNRLASPSEERELRIRDGGAASGEDDEASSIFQKRIPP